MTHYTTLGLENTCSENEIKQVFNLLNHENVNVILNSFELKVSFNT